jgi:formate dehydrogenase iron-sulfur subunit
MTGPSDNRTLIDELLEEQQRLTAVERFSRKHDEQTLPAQAKYYRDLIPLTLPKAGQQYAFEVDLDKCSGCKACVSACHSLNGLDEGEAWRDTGLLFSSDWRQPFQQTVTTACHHCVEPGCADGCPVLAYEKDPVTGIVRHLDDQCIGCQYCVMKCPYDVPKYSSKRGIVRKCDMCANRLAVAEAPACVQACPHEAIKITIVDQSQTIARAAKDSLLPAAPDSSYTKPTTCYVSAKALPDQALAGDHAQVRPEHSHLPLVFMLVLTQLAVGTSVAAVWLDSAKWLTLVAVAVGALALNIAALHLGKPLKAWRAFLGWRKSWFSREVIAFGAFVPAAALAAISFWRVELNGFGFPLKLAASIIGMIAVACSAMIYVDTRREFWNAKQSFGKFFGTTAVLGLAVSVVVLNFTGATPESFGRLVTALAVVTILKLAFERRIFRHLVDSQTPGLTPLNKTALLMEGELGFATRLRFGCGVLGGMVLPLVFLLNPGAGLAVAALVFCIVGELLERYLFFTAVAPLRMPGGVGT